MTSMRAGDVAFLCVYGFKVNASSMWRRSILNARCFRSTCEGRPTNKEVSRDEMLVSHCKRLTALHAVRPQFQPLPWCSRKTSFLFSSRPISYSVHKHSSSVGSVEPWKMARCAGDMLQADVIPQYPELAQLVSDGAVRVIRGADDGVLYFILGTAHVAKKSVEEVRCLIQLVRPEAVVVEVCAARAVKLLQRRDPDPAVRQQQRMTVGEAYSRILTRGLAGFIQVGLVSFYEGISSTLQIETGGEFVAAMEEAARVGATVIWGDRNQDVTVARLADSLAPVITGPLLALSALSVGVLALVHFHVVAVGALVAFVASLPALTVVVPRLLAADVNEAEIAQVLTEARQTDFDANAHAGPIVVDERDQYMVWSARYSPALPAHRRHVVMVVGAAHASGIVRRWNDAIDVDALLRVPGASAADQTRVQHAADLASEHAYSALLRTFPATTPSSP